MGRPPALTPGQQEQVRARLAAGETAQSLAAEFKVGRATIQRLSGISGTVRKVAETLAVAHAALEALPVAQQHMAMTLAEQLRSVSTSMAAAAVHSADTSQRLHAMANKAVRKIEDPEKAGTGATLQLVAGLTEMGNKAAVVPLGLVNSGKSLPSDSLPRPSVDPAKLSTQTLQELLDARDP